MDSVELKLETTRRDWIAFQFRQLMDRQDTRRRLLMWAFVPPTALIALALFIIFQLDAGTLRAVGTWVALLILPFYLMLVYGVVMSRLRGEVERSIKAGRFVGAFQVSLSQEGISVTRNGETISKNWQELPRAFANADYGFLFLDADDVVILPRRCFADEKEFEMFVKSTIIFQWHGENAIKTAAAALRAKKKDAEPATLEQIVISMPS